MNTSHETLLRRCVEISKEAVAAGNHPFGALLADKDGNILVESGNIEVTERDCTGHAETTVMRLAGKKYSKEFLWECTLYTTVEPCAMCAATQYWANIGRLVYGMDERRLMALTGDSSENPTMDIPSRFVFEHSQKRILVHGPFPEVEAEIAALHEGFWQGR